MVDLKHYNFSHSLVEIDYNIQYSIGKIKSLSNNTDFEDIKKSVNENLSNYNNFWKFCEIKEKNYLMIFDYASDKFSLPKLMKAAIYDTHKKTHLTEINILLFKDLIKDSSNYNNSLEISISKVSLNSPHFILNDSNFTTNTKNVDLKPMFDHKK